MAIDAKLIKELRDKTGMGITDCKKALEEASGCIGEAELLLRKRQKEKAIKKADRPTGQGVVAVAVENGLAVMIEVACEQEPTTGNALFAAFVELALAKALEHRCQEADALLATATAEGTLQDSITGLAGTVGENVQLRKVALVEAPAGGLIGRYVHFNRKAGAICSLAVEGAGGIEPLQAAANDICMHAVAARPMAMDRESIPADLVAREKEVYREEVQNKPANIQDKILEGKLRKFYAEKVLTEQAFVKDPEGKQTVAEMLAAAAKAAGGKAAITGFARFELGL